MAYFQFYTQYFILYNFKEQSNSSIFNNYFSIPPPLSRHYTRIFPEHILPASLVSSSHTLNTLISAPPEHSSSSGFLSTIYQFFQLLYTFLQPFSFIIIFYQRLLNCSTTCLIFIKMPVLLIFSRFSRISHGVQLT